METKFCSSCKTNKLVDDFHRRGTIRQSRCKACVKINSSIHYKNNRERIGVLKTLWRKEFTDWYYSLKENKPCADCGVVFHVEAMEWDHLPGFEKKACLSSLFQRKDKNGIIEEVKKCQLVCANCHAVRTYKRRCEKFNRSVDRK